MSSAPHISCTDCLAGLDDYRRGELESGEQQRIQSHLESCAACRSALAEHERIGNELRNPALLPPGEPDFGAMRRAALQELQTRGRTPFYLSSNQRNLFAIAASITAVLALAILLSREAPDSRTTPPREIASPAATPYVTASPAIKNHTEASPPEPEALDPLMSTEAGQNNSTFSPGTLPAASPSWGESKKVTLEEPDQRKLSSPPNGGMPEHSDMPKSENAGVLPGRSPAAREERSLVAEPPVPAASAAFSRHTSEAGLQDSGRRSAPEAAVPARQSEGATRQIQPNSASRASASAVTQDTMAPTALYHQTPGLGATTADTRWYYDQGTDSPHTKTSATLQRLLDHADTARLSGDWQRALSFYEKLVKSAEGPIRAEAQLRIADIFFEDLKDYTRAVHAYERCLEPEISIHLGRETHMDVRSRLAEARRLRGAAGLTP